MHAWMPKIVERLIGRTCVLECIDTNLLHPDDTITIDLWAWTSNPCKIPKKLWLTLTPREEVVVTTVPPTPWQKGAKYRVLPHLEWIHDYTMVSVNPHGSRMMP